jgi:hypothetical protein
VTLQPLITALSMPRQISRPKLNSGRWQPKHIQKVEGYTANKRQEMNYERKRIKKKKEIAWSRKLEK